MRWKKIILLILQKDNLTYNSYAHIRTNKPTEKWAKDMNRDHKKYIQTAIQQMKRCSTSLIKETQSKGTQRSHVSPVNLKHL